jgi:hypothetical protein
MAKQRSPERNIYETLKRACDEGTVPDGVYGPGTVRWPARVGRRFELLQARAGSHRVFARQNAVPELFAAARAHPCSRCWAHFNADTVPVVASKNLTRSPGPLFPSLVVAMCRQPELMREPRMNRHCREPGSFRLRNK